jgi:hypothetical protein
VPQRAERLLPRIQQLNAEHPCWGDRRLWAYLHCGEQVLVHKKRILRLRREHHLLGPPNVRLQAKRTPAGRNPNPKEWWGIDMPKAMVVGFGWLDIVVVRDGYTKKIIGSYAGGPCAATP